MSPVYIKLFSELSLVELYSILKLRVDVFVVEQSCPYPEIDNEDQGAIHFFCKDKNSIISYLRLITYYKDEVRIGRVVTDKAYRGKNISSKLLKTVMEYSNKNYAGRKIILAAQEHLQIFYEKFGFSSISEVYLEDNIPHIDMEYNL